MEDESEFNEGNEEESEAEEGLDPGNPEDYFAIIESDFNKVQKTYPTKTTTFILSCNNLLITYSVYI